MHSVRLGERFRYEYDFTDYCSSVGSSATATSLSSSSRSSDTPTASSSSPRASVSLTPTRSKRERRTDSAAPDGAATPASKSEASRDKVRSGAAHDECSPVLRAGCAPADKALASQTRHPCRLIPPGCATCRRSGFRVVNPSTVRPSVWRLLQPIRRLLLLTHPSDLQLPGVDLLPHQSTANSLPLRAAPGTTDKHVDVGHAPPSLPA